MKRHPALAHLSREHHGALILARLLQADAPAYKGLPTDTNGKAEYALTFYAEELISHFEHEEEVLKLVKGIDPSLDSLVETILNDHQKLHTLFKSTISQPDLTKRLDELGKALEIHVRKEERELFPLMEETVNEEVMAEIEKVLSSSL